MFPEDIPEASAQIGQHPAQARLVAETYRERFSFAHEVERVAVSTQRDQRDPKIQPCVDGFGQGLRTVRNTPEGTQRLLQPTRRGLVCGLRGRSAACLPEVRSCLQPGFSAEC